VPGKRILVIGCPGAGKSHFSRRLASVLRLPRYHLDMIYWNEDKTHVSREVFLSRLEKLLSLDEWIIDGNYISSMDLRMARCDCVIFLDFPLEVCLEGLASRRGKPRDDMPWVEAEDHRDEELISRVMNFARDTRPQIMALLEKHSYVNIIMLTSRQEADEYIEKLSVG